MGRGILKLACMNPLVSGTCSHMFAQRCLCGSSTPGPLYPAETVNARRKAYTCCAAEWFAWKPPPPGEGQAFWLLEDSTAEASARMTKPTSSSFTGAFSCLGFAHSCNSSSSLQWTL